MELEVPRIILEKMSTNHILMVRPVKFGFNIETAINNAFQIASNTSTKEVQSKALYEFDLFVSKLRTAGVSVTVIEDNTDPHTPDSIYPNNWISFHKEDATLCLFPMFAPNRRLERKSHILEEIEKRFQIKTLIDLSRFEREGKFLEGTGSMVLDRINKIAYACISPRTDKELFQKFCKLLNFKPISFTALDDSEAVGIPIYHTNVIMCLADKYAVICLDSIVDLEERLIVTNSLRNSGKLIILISYKQMKSFAGNMLQVSDLNGKTILVMSSQAFQSLTSHQINQIQSFDEILHSDLSTIESNGGGSARCMMAEIFLAEN